MDPLQEDPNASVGTSAAAKGFAAIFASWWAPVLVAMVALGSTLVTTTHMHKLAHEDRAQQARMIQQGINGEISEVFGRYTDALHHTKGFVLSSKHIDLHDWKAFVRESRLEKIHPGVWGFGYVQSVEPRELDAFFVEMASYGIDDFAIKPAPGPAGSLTDPLYVIKYEEPESRNRSAWGLNAAANPVNKSVYDAATDSGEHQLSNPFKLAQTSSESHLGAIMVAAHYKPGMPTDTVDQRRQAVLGWLAVVIDFTYFFERERRPGWDDAGITLRIEGADGELVVVHDDSEHTCASHRNVSKGLYSIDLAGGELLLELCVDRSVLTSDHDTYATISLYGGGAATLLVSVIAFLVARSRSYAYTLAQRMTIRLRESEHEAVVLAERATEASNAKSMFLANMSHEIRTPMTAIIGYAEIIEETIAPGSADELATPVKRIRSSGEHLLTLINDILDLSKIESGRFDINPTETGLAELIWDTFATLEGRAESKGIKLETAFNVPERVVLDGYRLKQVLINLVGNAIKFTEYGGVKLLCSIENDWLVFRVKDTGVGIKPHKLAEIFSPFSQVDESMTRRHQGTGLGLAISRALVELMGGELNASSTFGVGTEFVVTVPLEIAPGGERLISHESSTDSPDAATTPLKAAQETGKLFGRVLVAEDGPDNQKLIKHHLTKAGLDVEIVDNGLKAVEKFRAGEVYDLIVMDMQMPVMDGYLATSTLRDEGCETPVLALTAHAMAHDEQKCLDAGCDAYETKPIRKSSLIASITSLLSGPRRAAA